MPAVVMSPQVFAILSTLVADRAGLHFDPGHASIFADKVAARAQEAGFDSLLDYYYFMRYDAAGARELDALVDVLVVGETYLFRELAPLEMMVSELLLPAVAAGRRPRVWSAACATGEEPHTVAMLLAAHGVLGAVDLVASDISDRVLERARTGRFGRRALRQQAPEFAAGLMEIDANGVAVARRLTEAIQWRRINLIDAAAVAGMGTFDVVLCRNVLIYFNDQTVREVIDRLAARLAPGGTLFVGVSESLLRFGTQLSCEEHGGVFMYKKSQ
jgi:chemotaxis protein methyltransferase CheR